MLRLGLAGTIAGLVSFVVIEPFMRPPVATGLVESIIEAHKHAVLVFGVLGAIVSVGLTIGEELGSGGIRRLAHRGLTALLIGAVGGMAAGFFGQLIYIILYPLRFLGYIGVVMGRSAGWCLVGLVIGAAVGAAAGSGKRILLGAIGGLIGGGLGGLLFDYIYNRTGSDTPSRLVGFTLVGLATGLAIALVEELAKQAWITVLSGKNEGREYILTKPITNIGRDELADIPLFGDTSVARLHAAIDSVGAGWVFRDCAGSLVNNQPAQQHELRDGDLIRIGRFNLRFNSKGAPRSMVASTVVSGHPCPETGIPPVQPVQPKPRLRVASGPYSGRAFDITGFAVTIGRDPSNTIVLDQDPAVSRMHASVSYENGRYVVRDVGSSNGTFVNGARVTESALNPGDTLQIGGGSMSLVFE